MNKFFLSSNILRIEKIGGNLEVPPEFRRVHFLEEVNHHAHSLVTLQSVEVAVDERPVKPVPNGAPIAFGVVAHLQDVVRA